MQSNILREQIKFIYFDFSEVLFHKIAGLIGDKNIPVIKKYLATPNLVKTIETLAQYYRLGVCTNSRGHKVRKTLENFGLLGYFNTFAVAQEIGYKKPDVRMFNIAADIAKTSPSQIALVDDSITNLLGAKEAGFGSLFWYNHTHQVRSVSPELTPITDLYELTGIFTQT